MTTVTPSSIFLIVLFFPPPKLPFLAFSLNDQVEPAEPQHDGHANPDNADHQSAHYALRRPPLPLSAAFSSSMSWLAWLMARSSA